MFKFTHFKKFLFLILILVVSSCSKKEGTTSSKIKIFGSNAFSSGSNLYTRANNGLMLYGKSIDGKMFAKKIDNNSVDLIFPNGNWNFYAVAWESTGLSPTDDLGLRGKVSCAKSLGVQLNGADAVINLNLSNANCDNAFHPNSEYVGAERKLAKLSLFSCKDISGVGAYSSGALCDYDQATQVDNKGYATFVRIVVPEYNNFGQATTPAITSRCMGIREFTTSDIQSIDFLYANTMNFPKFGMNGFRGILQVFYSPNGCDVNNGFTTVELGNSTKVKNFISAAASTQTDDRYFLEADAAPVCQGPRLDPNFFASGKGTPGLPYTICTKDQFNKINDLYSDAIFLTNNKSFDLLADLNFNLAIMTPVGDATAFTGNFNGRNHRIENFRIKCPANNTSSWGLFRNVTGGSFSSLTINRGVVECDDELYSNNNVGLLIGNSSTVKLNDIKVFGHVSGDNYVGGVIGNDAYNTIFNDVHFEGEVKGISYVGGLAGAMAGNSSQDVISKSSVSVELRAKGIGTPSLSYLGGLVGSLAYTSSFGTIKESVARIKLLQGTSYLGGLVGNSENVNIVDSMVFGVMYSNYWTDGSTSFVRMGGLTGRSNSGSFSKNIVVVTRKSSKGGTDNTEGILIGDSTTVPSCPLIAAANRNFAFGFISGNGSINCNADALQDPSDISNPAAYGSYSSNWTWPAVDQGASGVAKDSPRLTWELTKENSVHYLKRECSGLHSVPTGDGTAASPFSICTINQFNNMLPNFHYKLKRNLFFFGDPITQKAAGIYRLDGDNYAIIDFSLALNSDGNHGIFQNLYAGSEIKNLNLILGKNIAYDSHIVNANNTVGLLAGVNSGIIKNIRTSISQINSSTLNLDSNTSIHDYIIGGLVGVNTTGGIIYDTDVDTSIKLYRPQNLNDNIYLASAVGKNDGTISIVRSRGDVSRSMGATPYGTLSLGASPSGCAYPDGGYAQNTSNNLYYFCNGTSWQPAYVVGSSERIAGVVAINNGSLSEVEYDGSLSVNDLNNFGIVAPFVATNSGSLFDAFLKSSFTSIGRVTAAIVGVNTGSINRVIFKPNTLSGFTPSVGLIFPGTQSENFCFSNAGTPCTSPSSISFTDPTITINGANLYWSVGTDFLNPNNNTWLFESNELSLMRTGGSFEKLGKGF